MDGSSRVSGARGGTHDRSAKVDRMKQGENIINSEIDYFGRVDLVDRAIKATGYIPLAFRDQPSLIKLSHQHINALQSEKTKCERALAKT